VRRHPRRRRTRSALPVAVVAGVLGAVVAPAAVMGGSVAWAHHRAAGHVYAVDDVPARPVALVLGAALDADGTPSPFLADRLSVARDLWERRLVRVVVVSGDNGEVGHDEPTAMRTWLVEHGVPAAAVVRDHAGFDTFASCYRLRHVFGVDRAVVVSQGYHVPRALAICRALGVDAVGVGAYTEAGGSAWRAGWLRELPADVKAAFQVAVHATPRFPGPPDDAVTVALRRPS